ncbi:MAG: tRNA (adenosine(37)-N6)-dimethylallyltransferase MiaA [Beijerinckiaceae bacterium]
MTPANKSAVLIAGPTASGKTTLAVSIAKRIGGSVINADSMQVYADLDILSARPDADERQGVEHLLFAHVDARVNYSAGKWLADAAVAMESVRASGRVPVVAGGTGLYFKALLHGLSQIPAVPEAVRASVRQRLADMAPEAMHAAATAADPEAAARIGPGDRQRLERVLEVFEATGKALSSFQGNRSAALLRAEDCACIFLSPGRDLLRERIDRRFDAMIERGAIEEVRRLMDRGLDPALPAMRAHGVPGLIDYLQGRSTLEEAVERGKSDTRRYAKRQFTWFRHQLPEFEWFAPETAETDALQRAGR